MQKLEFEKKREEEEGGEENQEGEEEGEKESSLGGQIVVGRHELVPGPLLCELRRKLSEGMRLCEGGVVYYCRYSRTGAGPS